MVENLRGWLTWISPVERHSPVRRGPGVWVETERSCLPPLSSPTLCSPSSSTSSTSSLAFPWRPGLSLSMDRGKHEKQHLHCLFQRRKKKIWINLWSRMGQPWPPAQTPSSSLLENNVKAILRIILIKIILNGIILISLIILNGCPIPTLPTPPCTLWWSPPAGATAADLVESVSWIHSKSKKCYKQ